MKVLNLNVLVEAKKALSKSRASIDSWLEITQAAVWNNHAEVKGTFASVSYIPKSQHCFNIGGNSYRLMTIISFTAKTVMVMSFMTHAEYHKAVLKTKK